MWSTGSTDSTSTRDASRCATCHQGAVQPTRLTMTLTYNGQSHAIDDDDALVCDACGDKLIDERAPACLHTHRALAPDAEMSVTVSRTTEFV
jgi:YgiT-type zinc finger domain-containing protein